MSFKDISYLELWRPFCSAKQNHLCKFGRGYQEEQFCEIILSLDKWFRRCHLKNSYLELWQPHCLVEWNHLCNFIRGHHGDHSYESKKGCKDQESIQSSTTPDPGYQSKSDKLTVKNHKREPRGQPFPSR